MSERRSWNLLENEAIVADYFAMLRKEIAGIAYSKAEHRRALQAVLDERTNSSIEWKHQNISAVLIELHCQYISGYQPARGYQQALRDVVEDRLAGDPEFSAMLAEDADRGVPMPAILDLSAVEVKPPKASEGHPVVSENAKPRYYVHVNYLEREAKNRELGRVGEEFVVELERWRLRQQGRADLASKVEHVAATRGDGDGYDVLSYETDGEERFIEVKTTKYGQYTPFFVTQNELRVSQENAEQFCLYRVFEFRRTPRLYNLRGSLSLNFALTPNSFVANVV